MTPKYRGALAAVPIFIVGMPRPASTLIEQILGTNPDFKTFSEQYFIPKLQFQSGLLRF